MEIPSLVTVFTKYSLYQKESKEEDWGLLFNLFFREFSAKQSFDATVVNFKKF